MSVRRLPARDRIARPWKNGGGVTRDVAVFPEGARDDDFLWRASIATVAAPGAFSAFPKIDRMLVLLRGELAIEIRDAAERRLRPGSPALAFRGEDAVGARPVGEACTVLNIMARRGRIAAKLDRWTAVRPTAADTLLLVASEPATIAIEEILFNLPAGDALLLDRPADLSSIDGPVIVAELFYQASALFRI